MLLMTHGMKVYMKIKENCLTYIKRLILLMILTIIQQCVNTTNNIRKMPLYSPMAFYNISKGDYRYA